MRARVCIGKSRVCLVVSVGASCLFAACLFSVLAFALIYFLKYIYLALTLTVLMCDGDDTDGFALRVVGLVLRQSWLLMLVVAARDLLLDCVHTVRCLHSCWSYLLFLAC